MRLVSDEVGGEGVRGGEEGTAVLLGRWLMEGWVGWYE